MGTFNVIWRHERQGFGVAMRSLPEKKYQVQIVDEWLSLGGTNGSMLAVADRHRIVDPGWIWEWALKLHMCEWDHGHGKWVKRSGWRG